MEQHNKHRPCYCAQCISNVCFRIIKDKISSYKCKTKEVIHNQLVDLVNELNNNEIKGNKNQQKR